MVKHLKGDPGDHNLLSRDKLVLELWFILEGMTITRYEKIFRRLEGPKDRMTRIMQCLESSVELNNRVIDFEASNQEVNTMIDELVESFRDTVHTLGEDSTSVCSRSET